MRLLVATVSLVIVTAAPALAQEPGGAPGTARPADEGELVETVMCGFRPGSPVVVELNDTPSITRSADAEGCIAPAIDVSRCDHDRDPAQVHVILSGLETIGRFGNNTIRSTGTSPDGAPHANETTFVIRCNPRASSSVLIPALVGAGAAALVLTGVGVELANRRRARRD